MPASTPAQEKTTLSYTPPQGPPVYTPPAAGPTGYPPPQQQGYAPQQQGYAPQPQGYVPQPQGYASQPQGHAPQPQTNPSQRSAAQIGEEFRAQLFAQCAQGIHQPTTKYGVCGIITAVICFPIGLICLFIDT
ncbi:hypothetical protein DFH07DRAFT_799814, partial [Mycena maculata]